MAMNKRHMFTIKGSCSCSMPGVWKAVAHNEGAAVIYHSPKSCGHFTHGMDISAHYRSLARHEFVQGQYTAPLLVTGLEDQHSIFGGAEQLRGCIEYVVNKHKPRYIMIANSCVSGVIGDDVQAIASEAEKDIGLPVLSVPCHGFMDNDYYAGYYHAGKALIDRFMEAQPTINNTVTLIGEGGAEGQIVQETKELLHSFGLKVHCYFPGYASLDEIKRVPASALCVILGGRPHPYSWISKLAVDIHRRFGVPFFDCDYPIGWPATTRWITSMGKFLGKEQDALRVEQEQKQRLNRETSPYCQPLQGINTVLCIGRQLMHLDPEWVLKFIHQAGLSLTGIVLLNGLTKAQQAAMEAELKKHTTLQIMNETQGEAVMQAAELLLTTHELAEGRKRQLFLPMFPPAGVGGMIALTQKLSRLAKRSEQRGGIVYG